jgi:transcriptional regulator with XRE-family HTH domain
MINMPGYDWIRNRRIALGMTQEQCATRAGISRTYLSQLERGVSANPTWSIVQRLAQVLGKSTFDEPEARFLASCYLCGIRTDLQMIPHRKDERLVGWIFACLSCAPSLYGAELIATLPDDPEAKLIAGGQDANRLRGP